MEHNNEKAHINVRHFSRPAQFCCVADVSATCGWGGAEFCLKLTEVVDTGNAGKMKLIDVVNDRDIASPRRDTLTFLARSPSADLFKCGVEINTGDRAVILNLVDMPNGFGLKPETELACADNCPITVTYSCAHRSIKDREEAARMVSRCLGNDWKQSADQYQSTFSLKGTHVTIANERVLLRSMLPAPTGLAPTGESQVFITTSREALPTQQPQK